MRRLQSMLVVTILLLLFGCAATKQARTVERLGFLKDLYPMMAEGNENAWRVFIDLQESQSGSYPSNTYTKFM